MKAKLLMLTVAGAVLLICFNIVRTQEDTLQQSGERLRLTQQHLDKGNLKAANSLLIQVEIDLAGLDKFYTLPSIKKQQAHVSHDLEGVHERFQASLGMVKDILADLKESGKSGTFQKAEGNVRKAVSQSEKNTTLLGLAAYLDRLKAQDFKGAEESIATVTSNLPNELNITEIATNLTALVQSERTANQESHAHIAATVKSRVDLTGAKASSGWQPLLKGRAMVWDFTKNSIDQAYELLPDNLRASSRDGVVTMFCVVKRENIERGRYSISNQPAYQEKMTIGVVYWPGKVSPGSAIVWGGEPPSSRPVKYSPEYGSAVKIKEWIAGLPTK